MSDSRLAAFRANVSPPDLVTGCTVWTGSKQTSGYGQFWTGSTTRLAHRIAYTLAYGPIPAGLVLHHTCGTKACVRPDHVVATTQRGNNYAPDGISRKHALKTHCPAGHPYSGRNLITPPRGGRQCRICLNDKARARYAAKKAT